MNSSQMSVASEYRGLAKAQKVEPSNAGMEGFMSAKVLVEGLRRADRSPHARSSWRRWKACATTISAAS
jgi:hypothetical protein